MTIFFIYVVTISKTTHMEFVLAPEPTETTNYHDTQIVFPQNCTEIGVIGIVMWAKVYQKESRIFRVYFQ